MWEVAAVDPHIAELLDLDLDSSETWALARGVSWYQDLIERLVRIRMDSGLTQTDVARRMGCSQPAVSNFERVGGDPHVTTVARYAAALDVCIQNHLVVQGSGEGEMPTIKFHPSRASDDVERFFYGTHQAR